MPAPVRASSTVAIEPERMNEITRKQVKNTSAVPKSPIRASAPTQTIEKLMNVIRFRLRYSRSSVEAPT